MCAKCVALWYQFLTRPKLADTEQGDDLRIGHKGQALLLLDHLRNIIHTQDTFHLSQDGEYHHASNDAEKKLSVQMSLFKKNQIGK